MIGLYLFFKMMFVVIAACFWILVGTAYVLFWICYAAVVATWWVLVGVVVAVTFIYEVVKALLDSREERQSISA